MRAFWALIAILLLGGAAVMFLSRPRPSAPSTPASDPRPSDTTPVEPAPTPPQPQAPAPAPAAATPVNFEKDLANAINTAVGAPGTAKPESGGETVELAVSPAWPAEKIKPSKVVRQGKQLVLDGEYRVTGSGTKNDPYVVPFELLMSAADVFDPRKGLTKMPQRIAFLHDKWVKINGYIAFPISSNDPRHMLVMFNQWDGCCIGVPPTTYDCIETNLAAKATPEDKLAIFATTTGVLRVDPYVDNGWLLGLYVLDQAEMSEPKSDGAPANAAPEN